MKNEKQNRKFKNEESIAKSFSESMNGVYCFSSDLTNLNKVIHYEYDELIGDFNYKSPFLSKTDFIETRATKTEFAIISVDTNFDDGGCGPMSTTASIGSVEVTQCRFGKKLPLCIPDIRNAFDNEGTAVFTSAMDEMLNVVYREREKRAILGSGTCVGAIGAATASGIIVSGVTQSSQFAVSTADTNGIIATLKLVTSEMVELEPAWLQLQTSSFQNLVFSIYSLNKFHVNPYDVVESEGGWPLPWANYVRVYYSPGGDSFSVGGKTKYALLHYDKKYTKATGYLDLYANGYDITNRSHILDTVIAIGVNFAVPNTRTRPIIALG